MSCEKLLITGGAGFIGANFINFYLEKYPKAQIVNLDKLTYAANPNNINAPSSANYRLVEGDICNAKLVNELFEEFRFDGVVHFAAESHVDNSIAGPEVFIDTNIKGTFNLLETSRKLWIDSPGAIKDSFKQARFLHISTDEVYGSLGEQGLFTEATAYAPNSPYSASKAAADFLVRSYYHTYGLPVLTTNCSNNYGPFQHDEKLIPTIIRNALKGNQIPIYGKGQNVRDWIYVLDHCKGVELVLQKGKVGETYNIGGENERNNLYIARYICQLLDEIKPKQNGSYTDQISFVKDRPGHDFRYAIDAHKIKTQLGWQAEENFETGIRKTLLWYLNHYEINYSNSAL